MWIRRKEMLGRVRPLIVRIRRGEDAERGFQEFRAIVEGELDRIVEELDTRWLVSISDTYADFGTPVERRNALLVSMLVNMEKVAQSYVLWRLNYEGGLAVPPEHEPRKLPLWDGMSSFHLSVGDVTNNMFARLERLLEPTPHLFRIYETVRDRIKAGETILGTLDRRHGHVFDTDFDWARDPRYDRWREDGTIPPWKK